MEKKLFSILFICICIYVMLSVAKYKKDNDVFYKFEENNVESVIEAGFPNADKIKELYGSINSVLSPTELTSTGGITIKDEDGFLMVMNEYTTFDVDLAVSKISELNDFCNKKDIPFAYVSYPSKMESEDYDVIYGIETNSEEIRNHLLDGLKENNVRVFNIRSLFENEGFSPKDIFYKTDHHWNTRAGLFSAKAIAEYMENVFGIKTYPDNLDSSLFTYTDYPHSWFGEAGRACSIAWVGNLDDFTYIKPEYPTSFSYTVPGKFEREGDFSILANESLYGTDYNLYTTSLHYSYMPEAESNTIVINKNLSEGAKVLIVKDSFTIVVAPFLSLACGEVNMWDMRRNEESLYDYIEENDFDAVLVAYTDIYRNDMYDFN